jgi:hypothetical protein
MKTTLERLRKGLSSVLMMAMPLLFMVFLGSQMALKQVGHKLASYRDMPEITAISVLKRLPPDTEVLLRGRLLSAVTDVPELEAKNLIVYQEHPANGREVRFQEVFNPFFPALEIALSDGRVRMTPLPESANVIQHPHHSVTIGDRQRSGFRRGDLVTVQGRWQRDRVAMPVVTGVTGISGIDKASLLSEWQAAICNVKRVSFLAGLLSALGLVRLILRVRQWRVYHRAEEKQAWRHRITKDVPATSLS